MKPVIFEGVCTALITPFLPHSQEIDFESLGQLIEFNISGGVDALLVLGTTGEAPTLTDDEKISIIEFASSAIAGRVPLIVGVGGNNPANIIKLSNNASAYGVDAVLLSSPYYNKATQAGLVKFFEYIHNNTTLPIIVYNVPTRTSINIDAKTICDICKLDRVVGVKEASGSLLDICDVCRLVGDKVAVYSGDDALTQPIMSVGGVGVISVASNVLPSHVCRQVRLMLEGKYKQANVYSMQCYSFYRLLFAEVNPICVKYMASYLQLCSNVLRLPLTTVTPENANKLQNAFNLIAN